MFDEMEMVDEMDIGDWLCSMGEHKWVDWYPMIYPVDHGYECRLCIRSGCGESEKRRRK